MADFTLRPSARALENADLTRPAGDARLARVQRVDRNEVQFLWSSDQPLPIQQSARLSKLGLVTGDWVWIDNSSNVHLVDRYSELRRASRSMSTGQIVASNVDVVLLAVGAHSATRPRLIERLAAIGWDSDALPVFVVTKTDTADKSELADVEAALHANAPGVEIVMVSARTGEGLNMLSEYLTPTGTAVLIGHSGVGKSTLVNALIGHEHQSTGLTRDRDEKGRHTTTSRELLDLGPLGFVIDTPGVRELGVQTAESVEMVFTDVTALASQCHFRDCEHNNEPGCAIQAAVFDGTLAISRLRSFMRLQREAAFAESKSNAPQRNKNTEWTRFSREYRKARGH